MRSKAINIAGSLLSLYFFISGIMVVKVSAGILADSLTDKIVYVIRDVTSAVVAGWFGTALLHSSGAFDSIVVALVSSNVMPIGLAVSTILGAELGTTVTPFLISILNRMKGKGEHAAAFNVTVSHVLYNLITLSIFYCFEVFFGGLTRIAIYGESIFIKAPWLDAVPDLLKVITPWVKPLLAVIPAWVGFIAGAAMLVLALAGIERYMTEIFNMPRSWNLIQSTFKKPLRAFVAGLLFTMMIPSTTVMVSLLIPLANSGVINADYYILPYILGANIGTVFDVMVAAMATGDPVSMGVWLVHLTVNIVGALIFLPLLKPFSAAVKKTSAFISESPKRALTIAVVFHLIPALIIVYYIISG